MSSRRRNFSLATIKQRLEHCSWQCEGKIEDGSRCPTIVSKGRFRCDHVIPDRCGGKPTFENAQILCLQCDGVKTPIDLKTIGKIRRQEIADLGVKARSLRPLPCGKKSPFKKKIDGRVVLRVSHSSSLSTSQQRASQWPSHPPITCPSSTPKIIGSRRRSSSRSC